LSFLQHVNFICIYLYTNLSTLKCSTYITLRTNMLYKNLPKISEGHTEMFNWQYLSFVGPVHVPWTTAVELKFLEGAHFNALCIQYWGLKFNSVLFVRFKCELVVQVPFTHSFPSTRKQLQDTDTTQSLYFSRLYVEFTVTF
jgi:hypothetical protein